MTSPSDAVSPHGFTLTRRGYDPAQVDQALSRFIADRDAAWQRLSGLGDRMRALEQTLLDAAEAEQAAAQKPPPTYAELGERAARLLVLAQEEAAQLRAGAERWIEALDTESRADARRHQEDAEGYAAQRRGSADEAFRRALDAARATAGTTRGEADRESRAVIDQAAGYAAELRLRGEQTAEEVRRRLSALQHTADQADAAAEAEAVARETESAVAAERRQDEAERHLKAMRAAAAATTAEAAAAAERLVEAAQREAERVAAGTERERLALAEERDQVQAHLDHILTTLTALTGAAVAEVPEPEVPAEASDLPHPADNAHPDEH